LWRTWGCGLIALLLLAVLGVGMGIGVGGAIVAARSNAAHTTATSAGGTTVAPNVQDLQQTMIATVKAVEPSVVEITSRGGGNGEAIGSGEMLTTDGYMVTNDHVVDGFSSFTVRLADGETLPATLAGQDAQDDLAVLKVALTNATPIAFADSSSIQVGAFAIALGSPLGLQDSVTFGIVSALNRTASEQPDGPASVLAGLIQTSAPINPGNSGGALVDLQGRLIGIPTLGITNDETGGAAEGIGFAIPANRVKYVTQQLIANGRLTSSGQGYLGIEGRDIAARLAAPGTSGGVVAQSGVEIVAFASDASGGSPAQAAGLRIGDLILAVNGQPVNSGDDLAAALLTRAPGTQVTLQIVRGSSASTVRATLGERPV
jgi:S1-C subfamily serine protease